MPHQCTDCGRSFADGSKEMLSGCPECGGNKFQFIPKGAVDGTSATGSSEPPSRDSNAGAVSKATDTVRDWVGRKRSSDDSSQRSWPKSATEDYDTPAEKAAARANESTNARSEAGGNADTGSRVETDSPANAADAGNRQSAERESAATPTDQTAKRRSQPNVQETQPQSDSQASPTTGSSEPEQETDDGPIGARMGSSEDNAQANARSDMVQPDELPGQVNAADTGAGQPTDAPRPDASQSESVDGRRNQPPNEGRVVAEPSDTEVDDRPDLDELRQELNQQFESIKILNPGQYELNLMELYDREEYIISLREDGRYVIDVPESWRGSDE
ncbi:OapC/ArvC family zinc-ribbon domain-containing protein [Haloarchaeobius sp. DFWS5]|uniref:Zn-ribbon domain-containing protein n=1 Tax=Haloarchaeobius sp. DFWS5 TaxID=3446114 RepID=UPI003EBC82EA